MKNKIELFVPDPLINCPLDITLIEKQWGKKVLYAARGRFAIYHILKSFNLSGKVLLPAYFCESVLVPLNALNLEYEFCDLDERDLNIDVKFVEQIVKTTKISALIVPSFYGNPASLEELEELCKSYGILMIDDAAQAYGAQLNGRYVGSFGNGGLMAFSPGKPTAAHQGAFFWTEADYSFTEKHHKTVHKLNYYDFLWNRVNIYDKNSFLVGKYFHKFCTLLERKAECKNDAIEIFERDILGGVLKDNLEKKIAYRNFWFGFFESAFCEQNEFRILKSIRGVSNNCKLVLVFNDEMKCKRFKEYLYNNRICFYMGYKLLPGDHSRLDTTLRLAGRIVELPIENNKEHMIFLYESIKTFLEEF